MDVTADGDRGPYWNNVLLFGKNFLSNLTKLLDSLFRQGFALEKMLDLFV